ncbi:magnesium chelatase subunit ChlD, partial [Pseudomonas syringae pv. actinidiae ICMP 19101]
QGAVRAGADGPVQWLPTLLRGRPKSRKDLVHQPRSSRPNELLLRRRARLALLTASGSTPRWQHHGFKASSALNPWLDALGAGGGTPLSAALQQAMTWLEQRQKRHPAEQQRVLVMTDGRIKQLPTLPAFNCASLLIDIEKGPIRLGRARELAASLGADYRHIDELKLV